MKRYIKEMANDVQREIDREIKNMQIPFGELAELGRDVNFILKEYKNSLMTDRDAVSALLVTWDKLKEWQWKNAEEF